MNYLEEIKKYKDELLKDLKGLINIPSVYDEKIITANEPFGSPIKEALNYMLSLGEKDGFVVKNYDNYAGHIVFGEGQDIIGVLGHLDVVPVNGNWIYPPFSGTIADGKIYGRGASDDKGPTIAAYYALRMLKDAKIPLKKRIHLILGCDEETGKNRCLNHYFKYEKMPSFGFTPDAEFPLINGEKGIVSFDIIGIEDNIISMKAINRYNIVPDYIEVVLKNDYKKEFMEFIALNKYQGKIDEDKYIIYGEAHHAMEPQKGINAISIMVKFLHQTISSKLVDFMFKYLIDNEFGHKININYYDEIMKDLTMNLGFIDLENNKFKIGLNFRIPKNECIDIIKREFNKVLHDYELIQLNEAHVHYVSSDDEDVQKLLKVYREYTHDMTPPYTIGGGTYAQSLEKAVAFGALFPKREATEHMTNEYMYIEDILKASAIYAKALEELCK